MMTKPWLEFREVIVKLYINEGRTLADVRGIMKDRHGFEASIRSYRQHFDSWDVNKYNCKKRNHRRQQKAHARGSLPSPPPETSMVGMVPIDRLMASPESLTRSSSISSSSQSNLSDTSPRVIQPRPLQRPYYYDLHAFEHTGAAFRGSDPRCSNAEGSPAEIWGEMNMRDPSISDGSPPSLPVELPNSSLHRGGLAKYVPAEYPDPSWGRSSYQVSHHAEPKYYGQTYEDSVPRCMPEPFSPPFHRQGEYQQPLRAPRPRPRSMPRLPMMQSGSAEQVRVE